MNNELSVGKGVPMLSRTVVSLAILKANWDFQRHDFVDNFIPFFVHLIRLKEYKVIKIEEVQRDFASEFGLLLSYHAAISISNKAIKKGVLKKEAGEYKPIFDRIKQNNFSKVSGELDRKLNNIVDLFIKFAEKEHAVILGKDKAELALLSFLKQHDASLLFAAEKSSLLPSIKSKKSDIYLISDFIKHAYESNATAFNFLLDVSVGHIMASTILYEDFSNYVCNFKGMRCYLDTAIILRLIGAEGRERQKPYEEFIKSLLSVGAKIFVFEHTYDETTEILENCLKWIDNPQFDPTHAGKTLLYFTSSSYTVSDVEDFIVRVPEKLKSFSIERVSKPSYNTLKSFQIDEDSLKAHIIQKYKEGNPNLDEYEKEGAIQRDIDTIASIYRLRGNKVPKSLKDASHVFVTTNSGLARAAGLYKREVSSSLAIPACLTDVFVGTIIWLEKPKKFIEINTKRLVSEAYAALLPNEQLIRTYLLEIKKLKQRDDITDKEYFLLRSSRVALNLLESHTLNDPESFNENMPHEILKEIEENIRLQESQRYEEDRLKHESTEKELNNMKDDLRITKLKLAEHKGRIEKTAHKLSRSIAYILFSLLSGAIVRGAIASILELPFLAETMKKYASVSSFSQVWIAMCFLIFFIFSIISVIFGRSLINFVEWIAARLKIYILIILGGKS